MKYSVRALIEIDDEGKDLSDPLTGRLKWTLDDYMVLDAMERKAKLVALQVKLEPTIKRES